jgi:hypothetical protein
VEWLFSWRIRPCNRDIQSPLAYSWNAFIIHLSSVLLSTRGSFYFLIVLPSVLSLFPPSPLEWVFQPFQPLHGCALPALVLAALARLGNNCLDFSYYRRFARENHFQIEVERPTHRALRAF